MRLLHIGLGSMGKRRIRNIRACNAGVSIGYDPREDRRLDAQEAYGITTFSDIDAALAEKPDALIVSTPPDLHMPFAKIAAERGLGCFCEAGTTDVGLDQVMRLAAASGAKLFPSCTLRFNPLIRRMKALLDEGAVGRPLVVTHHLGQYLPDWHPWESYRDFYASKRETGACREMVPFELVWMTWLFGPVKEVSCFHGKVSDLEMEADDVYQLIVRFESGVYGHLLIDLVARDAVRMARVVAAEGTIEWIHQDNRLRVFQAGAGAWQEVHSDGGRVMEGYSRMSSEEMYEAEMEAFVRACRGEPVYPFSFEEDRAVLAVLTAAEQSAMEGRHVKL